MLKVVMHANCASGNLLFVTTEKRAASQLNLDGIVEDHDHHSLSSSFTSSQSLLTVIIIIIVNKELNLAEQSNLIGGVVATT